MHPILKFFGFCSNMFRHLLATHLGSRQQSTSIHRADFTHDKRKCASSLGGTHSLPEDDVYVPKHVGAKAKEINN
jgi:hypothetical protein